MSKIIYIYKRKYLGLYILVFMYEGTKVIIVNAWDCYHNLAQVILGPCNPEVR